MDMLIDRKAISAIRQAVTDYDLTSSPAWDDISILASNVLLEGFDLDEDSVTGTGRGPFQAIANVYLVLEYGRGDDGFSTSESFRADIEGEVTEDGAVVSGVTVDTSPFYE